MYFNDVHILLYLIIFIIGLLVGHVVSWSIEKLANHKKISPFTFIQEEWKKGFNKPYGMMILVGIVYISLLYKLGIQETIIANLKLVKYFILSPMLISIFIIDYKYQIIPNRITLTMFEIGIIIAFLYGFSNVAITIDMLIGMLIGGGMFLIITLIGTIFYGKEAMGMGDIKLMGALGLYFGISNIVVISLMSFLLGAIISLIRLIFKNKKINQYVPFGPFIVTSTFICMYVPLNEIINVLINIFTLGLYR